MFFLIISRKKEKQIVEITTNWKIKKKKIENMEKIIKYVLNILHKKSKILYK